MKTFRHFLHLSKTLATTAALMAIGMPAHAAESQITPADIPIETQSARGTARYNPPLPAHSKLPTLWLIGDSTVRNGSAGWSDADGQWGWGAPLTAYFDLKKINVVNRALGGTSSRSFYRDQWPEMRAMLKKGDFVIVQFGANDHGGAKGKGALRGTGEETEMNNAETVRTFGWYLRQYITESRAAGATPIICSLTPRLVWLEDGTFARGGSHAEWAGEVAAATKTPFIPLNELIAREYERLGRERVAAFYKDHIHTGWDGATANAGCVISGLKALPENPLARYFSKRADAIPPARP